MEGYLFVDIFVLIINFFAFVTCVGDGNIKLQVCTQTGENEEFLPLIHSTAKAIQFERSDTNKEMDVDLCVRDNMMKITLHVEKEINGKLFLCFVHHASIHSSSPPVCYDIGQLEMTSSNKSITCWFHHNVTNTNIVEFYAKLQPKTSGSEEVLGFYSNIKIHNKGMCDEHICERVEPEYPYIIFCGEPWLMIIPNNSVLFFTSLICTSCQHPHEDAVLVKETNQNTVELSLDDSLESWKYNLTVWLEVEDEHQVEICPYRKIITVVCKDPVNASTNKEPKVLPSKDQTENEKHCEENPQQCSFGSFVLFGVAVSSVFMVLICFVTFLLVQRKKIAKAICSPCCGNSGASDMEMGSPTQLSPMIPNNLRRTSLPVSMHLPKHAHFHRLDESFRLVFLPHPYDQFTRDCTECLRKILTLDGRIRSACVFDQSVTNEIFANKFNWIDNTINDIHNIIIFLCFTSLSIEHEQSIVDDVMKVCKLPATRPACQVILARVTESPNVTHDPAFHGTRINITNEKSYKEFLKAVYSIYGYRDEDDHDKQKLKQIVHCGASHGLLKKFHTCPSHHV